MGFFEALFDFDGDGKVGLDDDLMFMWMTHHIFSEEEKKGRSSDDQLLDLGLAEEAVDAHTEKATRLDLQCELGKMRSELLSIQLPGEIAKKEMAKEAEKAYRHLLTRLHKMMPEDDGSLSYFDCIELEHDIEGYISFAKKIYRIFSGDFSNVLDDEAIKAEEIAELEAGLAEWGLKEPRDCCSEAWAAWDEKRQELQDEIEERKEDW